MSHNYIKVTHKNIQCPVGHINMSFQSSSLYDSYKYSIYVAYINMQCQVGDTSCQSTSHKYALSSRSHTHTWSTSSCDYAM